MGTIGELATPHPVQVLPQTPVFEAARRMADLGIGDVIVTDEDRGVVVGMVTDRDIAVRVVACNLDPATTPVEAIYTPDVTTVRATASPRLAAELMQRDAIRRLPVVNDDGTLAGVVSVSELVGSPDLGDDELREVIRALDRTRRPDRSTN